jgi:circadian clock protein KaiB
LAKRALSAIDLAGALKRKKRSKYVLRLYVAGITRRSSAAIRTLTGICDEYLEGRFSLEIIDIYRNPTLAKGEQIIAVPTPIKTLPSPLRKLVGDMSDRDKVLLGLDLVSAKAPEAAEPVKKRHLQKGY